MDIETAAGGHPVKEIRSGRLIINADDWGRTRQTTQCIEDCVIHGTVNAVSAMAFMEDSERAAAIARERGIDSGLHLNLTTGFSSTSCPTSIAESQRQIIRYLAGNRFAKYMYNPFLVRQFRYVVAAQIDEYRRLYGKEPARLDGHHHMHLSLNVLVDGLLPAGAMVRRNFSFSPGEKSFVNRSYRHLVDKKLSKRHRLTDYFFSLPPLEPRERIAKILSLANRSVVELETHPVNLAEYQFLLGQELPELIKRSGAALA